jgi:hypothetical protein
MRTIATLFLFAVALTEGACTRDRRPADEDPRVRQLVGTWREDGLREYVLAGDGTFSMKLTTPARCRDASTDDTTTNSGRWSVKGGSLVLEVTTSTETFMQGVTMTDEIVALDGATLVLNSSVINCSGQRIRLSRK